MSKKEKAEQATEEETQDVEQTEEGEAQGGREAGRPKLPLMSILSSDGTLRLQVPEGTEGCVRREYETSDGTKGVKHELVFKSLSGKITNMDEFDGDYGTSLLVTLTYDGGEDIIAFSTGTPFGEDFMKKLPNINLEEFVTIQPYSFTDDTSKLRKGLSIKQGDEKIMNFFSEKDGDNWKNLHGYPDPTGDEKNADDWKLYFLQARKFLLEYTRENFISKFAEPEEVKADEGF